MKTKKHWISISWLGLSDLLKGNIAMEGMEIPKKAKITSIDWKRCTFCYKFDSDHAGFCNGEIKIHYKL